MPTLHLRSLLCRETDDPIGADEPYIEVNGDRVWGPGKIEKGGTCSVDVSLEFGARAEVWIREHDAVGADDNIGHFHVFPDEAGKGPQEAHLNGEFGRYSLSYEVK